MPSAQGLEICELVQGT